MEFLIPSDVCFTVESMEISTLVLLIEIMSELFGFVSFLFLTLLMCARKVLSIHSTFVFTF